MFFVLNLSFSAWICLELISDARFSNIIQPVFNKILALFVALYFIFCTLLLPQNTLYSLYFLIPPLFIFSFFYFLQTLKSKSLISHIQNLLPLVSSQMKLGFSFITAWKKTIEETKDRDILRQLLEISETLQFKKNFYHQNESICHLVKDLVDICHQSQPLKYLTLLQEKIKIEKNFHRKANQVLFQLRLQSSVIGLLYFGLLIWTAIYYGNRHLLLMLTSFLSFTFGLFWIMKTGRKMKWSL